MRRDDSNDQKLLFKFWIPQSNNIQANQIVSKISDPTANSLVWRDLKIQMKEYSFNIQAINQILTTCFEDTANPQKAKNFVLIIHSQHAQTNYERLWFWFFQAIQLKSQLQSPCIPIAMSFELRGSHEQMFQIFLEHKIEINTNFIVKFSISTLCQEICQYTKSLILYNKLIQLFPETITYYISYIQCVSSNKLVIEVDDCWMYLAKVMILLKPNEIAIAYYLRGLILRKQERIGQAIEFFKKSINADKDYISAYRQLGKTYWQINHPLFLEPFHHYLSIHPGQLSMMAAIGMCHYHKRNYEKCSEIMQAMITQYNAIQSPTFQPFVLRYLVLSGQHQAVDKYVQLHPLKDINQDQAMLQQAVICSYLLGDSVGVIINLQQLITTTYIDTQITFKIRLALEYVKIGERQKAENIIIEIEQILQKMTRDQITYFLFLLVEINMYKKASQIFEKRIKYSENKLENTSQIYLAYSLSLIAFELGNSQMTSLFSQLHERIASEWGNPIFSIALFVKAQFRIGNRMKAQKYYKMLEKQLEETKMKGFQCQKQRYQKEMKELQLMYERTR